MTPITNSTADLDYSTQLVYSPTFEKWRLMKLPDDYRKYTEQKGVTLWSHTADKLILDWISDKCIEARQQVRDYFGNNGYLASIQIVITRSRADYEMVVTKVLGVDIEIPSRTSRIAQPQGKILAILSPNAYSNESCYVFNEADFSRLLVHEFTHMTVEEICPSMDTIPGWVHEGLSVLVSRQGIEEAEFFEPFSAAIKSGAFPTLLDVISQRQNFYIFGWALIDVLAQAYGKKHILNLLQQPWSESSLSTHVGGEDKLETLWKEHLEAWRTKLSTPAQ
jgi:hypothetical protein